MSELPATVETPVDDLWTSTPTPDAPASEPTPEPDAPTSPDAPEPSVDAAQASADLARDEAGKFTATDKPKSKRTNPYEAVKAATGETARERDLRVAAEAKASDLERRVAELSKPKEPEAPAPKPEGRPTWEQFRDDPKYAADPLDAYYEALAEWKADQRLATGFDERVAAVLEQREAEHRYQEHLLGIAERGRQAYPDYNEVLNAAPKIFTDQILGAIAQMDGPEHIAMALARNIPLAQKIVALDNPVLIALELAKLNPSSAVAARPDSTSTARSSSAKPPINRVGGSASAVPVDPDDLEFGPEFIKAENERDKRRQASR